MTHDDFTHRTLRASGKRAHRLGLALNYGLDADGLAHALDRGVNYFFWTSLRTGRTTPVLREALKRDRERYVVSAVATIGFLGGGVRRGAESALRALGTDYLDVYQLGWLGVSSAWTEGTIEALLKLREEGKVRAIGVSIHDRPRAGRLAEDSPLDMLMVRYNAAHPGAEKDIFPHLAKRQPTVVAYTATAWRKLLKRPSGWTGDVMTGGDCYRFCLSSPHVDVALCGPANRAQLDENLDALEKGPLTDDESRWMRDFGRAVHG
jgi:aryl-alcohol dehydrogenase-like predicted oxidoreductase